MFLELNNCLKMSERRMYSSVQKIGVDKIA